MSDRARKLDAHRFQARKAANLLPYARDGSAKASAILAQSYHKGRGVKRNLDTAIQLYTKAANAEKWPSIPSMYNLGTIYSGRNNWTKALEWFEKAAKQEMDEAWKRKDKEVLEAVMMSNFILGTMYEGLEQKGSVDENKQKAINYYLKGASLGHAKSQFNLATLLFSNTDPDVQDKKEAIKWYTKAASQKVPEASFMLAQIHLDGEETKVDLNKAMKYSIDAHAQGIEEARALSEEIRSKKAQQQRKNDIHRIEERLRELRALDSLDEDEISKKVVLYKISSSFRFSVRSERSESIKKATGKILKPGTIFKVSSVHKGKRGLSSQTFLELADGSGWVFTDHPNPKDDRKLATRVLPPPRGEDKKGQSVDVCSSGGESVSRNNSPQGDALT
mmetsp:Transcript_22369/g.43525  ORF Transcript_22369/g.43525 Transcript_22369/m.43525 type:complete len:391 (+) Transcript_22369:36-1208(+)